MDQLHDYDLIHSQRTLLPGLGQKVTSLGQWAIKPHLQPLRLIITIISSHMPMLFPAL